jgi:hypothetical protein
MTKGYTEAPSRSLSANMSPGEFHRKVTRGDSGCRRGANQARRSLPLPPVPEIPVSFHFKTFVIFFYLVR